MRANSLPIGVAIHRFMETDKINGYARDTRRQYRRVLTRLADANPRLRTDQIEPHHLDAVLRDSESGADATVRTSGAKPGRRQSSINIDRSILRVFIGWCQDRGYLLGNPAADIKRVKIGQTKRYEDWVLNMDQVEDLLDAAARRHPRDHMAVCLGLYAGMRDSEICQLQWADVSFARQQLDFFRDKQDERIQLPMNQQLLAALRWYHAWYTDAYGPIDPNWYVIPARYSSPVRTDRNTMAPTWKCRPWKKTATVIKDVKALLTEVGVPSRPGQGVHMLRRTFAAMLLEATGDIRDVTVALGHDKQATTEAYLFRNAEADRLRGRYQNAGFHLGNRRDTHSDDNVVDLRSRRSRAS